MYFIELHGSVPLHIIAMCIMNLYCNCHFVCRLVKAQRLPLVVDKHAVPCHIHIVVSVNVKQAHFKCQEVNASCCKSCVEHRTGAKIINVFRAWIGAQLTICAQK